VIVDVVIVDWCFCDLTTSIRRDESLSPRLCDDDEDDVASRFIADCRGLIIDSQPVLTFTRSLHDHRAYLLYIYMWDKANVSTNRYNLKSLRFLRLSFPKCVLSDRTRAIWMVASVATSICSMNTYRSRIPWTLSIGYGVS